MENIINVINENLSLDDKIIATEFVSFLHDNGFEFYRDTDYWKDKVYYWVKYKDECVCFISIKDYDESENRWTVWTDDIASDYLSADLLDEKTKRLAWSKVDVCGHCGSCSGGKNKVIFGKVFDSVCGCTFRFDNPSFVDLEFMKMIVEVAKKQIDN